jgi:hypothetical protein
MERDEQDPRLTPRQGSSYTGSMNPATPELRREIVPDDPVNVRGEPIPRLKREVIEDDTPPQVRPQAQAQPDRREPVQQRERGRNSEEANAKPEWNIARNIRESVEIAKDDKQPDYKRRWHAQALQRWARTLATSPELTLTDPTNDVLRTFLAMDFTNNGLDGIPVAIAPIEKLDLAKYYEKVQQQYPDDAQCVEHLLFHLARHDRGKTTGVRESKDQFMPGEKYSLLNPDGTANKQNYQFFMRAQHVYFDDDGTWKPYEMMNSFGYEYNTRAGGKAGRSMGKIYNDPDYFQQRHVVFSGNEAANDIRGRELFGGEDADFRGFQNAELFGIDITVDRLQDAHRSILYAGATPDSLYNKNLMVQGEDSRWSHLINLSTYENPGDAVLGDAFKGGWNAHRFLLELFHPDGIHRVKDGRGVEVSMLRKVLKLKGFSEMCKAVGNEILAKNLGEVTKYAASIKDVLEERWEVAVQQGDTNSITIYEDVLKKLDVGIAGKKVAINLFDNQYLAEAIKRVGEARGMHLTDNEINSQVRQQIYDSYVPGLIASCEAERVKVAGTAKEENYKNAIDALQNLLPLVGMKRDMAAEQAQIQTDRNNLDQLSVAYHAAAAGSDEQQELGRQWNALNNVRKMREARFQSNDLRLQQQKRAELLQVKGMNEGLIGEEWANTYIDEAFAQRIIGIAGYTPEDMLPFNAPTRDLVVQRIGHRSVMAGVWGSIDKDINPIDKQYVSNIVWNSLPYTIWTNGDYLAIAQGGTEYTRQKRLRLASGRAGAGPLILVNGIKKANPGYGRVIRHSRKGEANFDTTTEELLQGGTGVDWDPTKYRGNWYAETDAEKGYGSVYKNSTELPDNRAKSGLLGIESIVKEEKTDMGGLLVTEASKEHAVQGSAGAAKSLWETYLRRSKIATPKYYFGSEYNPGTHKYELGWYYGTGLTEMFEPTVLALDSIMNAKNIDDPDRSLARPAFAYEVAMEAIGHYYDPEHYGNWGDVNSATGKITESASGRGDPRVRAFVGLQRLSISTAPHEVAPGTGIIVDHPISYFTADQLQTLLTPKKYFQAVADYKASNPVVDTPPVFSL